MNTQLFCSCCALLLGVSLTSLSAGSLTPPAGPPQPTMKTLDEIEPRTAIHDEISEIIIDLPGNYYAVEPIVNAGRILIESGGVTLDLGGFSHDLEDGIDVFVSLPGSEVLIQNGKLLNSATIEISGHFPAIVKALTFEGGGVEMQDGDALEVLGCRFNGASGASGAAIYGQRGHYAIHDSVFQDYNEAIVISGLEDEARFLLSDSLFSGNTAALILYGDGEVSVRGCFFDGAGESNAQQPRAFEFSGAMQVEFAESSVRNYELVLDLKENPPSKLLVLDSKFSRFDTMADVGGGNEEPLVFKASIFDGRTEGGRAYKFFESSLAELQAEFIDCALLGFDQLTPVAENFHLRFQRCRFDFFESYDWPHGSHVIDSNLVLRDGLTIGFNSGLGSQFSGSEFVAGHGYSHELHLHEGAVIDDCEIKNLANGVVIQHHSVVLRNSSILFDSNGGQGQIAVENYDGDDRKAALIENCTIRGYQTALDSGNFQAHELMISDSEKAFDNVHYLQLSKSSVYVENLGEVHGVAVMTDSTLRTSNVGLWVGRVEMLNCSVSNQDENSSRGLEIHHGGSIRNSNFSGFYTGVYALDKIAIDESTISSCVQAIYIDAAGSVITDNTVIGCDTGIEAGTGATVVGNTVSVQSGGIFGSGLIVKNAVIVTAGTPYSFGSGTLGRELTGEAINPNPSPSVEDAGEPWANVYESF